MQRGFLLRKDGAAVRARGWHSTTNTVSNQEQTHVAENANHQTNAQCHIKPSTSSQVAKRRTPNNAKYQKTINLVMQSCRVRGCRGRETLPGGSGAGRHARQPTRQPTKQPTDQPSNQQAAVY